MKQKLSIPKSVRGVYERIKYIETHYGNVVVKAMESAKTFNVNYYSYEDLFAETISPITGQPQKIPPSIRYKTARRTLGLLTGTYQQQRAREYGRNYSKVILEYSEDMSLYDRFVKAMKSKYKEEILRDIKSVNMFYVSYRGKRGGKSRRKLNAEDSGLDGKRIDSNLQLIADTLTKYGF